MTSTDIQLAAQALENAFHSAISDARGTPYEAEIRELLKSLISSVNAVEEARAGADPPQAQSVIFDAADPKVAARTVALALLAQPMTSLSNVEPADGSGIFAIYYTGAHPLYRDISDSETPIYIGRAPPARDDAISAREQGESLTRRLSYHAASISAAEAHTGVAGPYGETIRLVDFHYRRFVCPTPADTVAKRFLVEMFWPLWNDETRACWGLAKHDPGARRFAAQRSPWDVAHPGRLWALDKQLKDSLTQTEIRERVELTMRRCPARHDRSVVLHELIDGFRRADLEGADRSIPPIEVAGLHSR